MAAFFRRNRILSVALSLFLLAASVVAPFRTQAFGRMLLFGSAHDIAHSAVIRVLAVAGGGFGQGFRAVVDVSKGGPGGRSAEIASRAYPYRSSFSLESALPLPQGALLSARPHPPLRC